MHSCNRRLWHELSSGSKHLYLDQSLNIFRDINGWLWKPSMVKICHQYPHTQHQHRSSRKSRDCVRNHQYKDSQQSKSDKFNVATGVKYGVYIHLHHKTPWRILPPLTGEHLEQTTWPPPILTKDPHMVGWEYLVHKNSLTMLGWTIMVRCNRHWRSAGIYHGPLLHLQVSLILNVIPKTCITRRDCAEYCFLSQVNTLNKHREVGSHMPTPRAKP